MRRTNVAMTRARRHLVLIGDSTTISNEPFIKGMVAYCHKHGDVHSAYEYVNGMLQLLTGSQGIMAVNGLIPRVQPEGEVRLRSQ